MISVVIPVYNESNNIGPMCAALREMAAPLSELEWEFLFVDDGSADNTFALLLAQSESDSRIKVVQLSRNFGGATSDSAGLQFASGDAAVVMAGDLQDHPREIPRFLEKWRQGFHVVWGVRASREDPAMDRLLSRCFAAIIRRIALPNYPPSGTGGFCLIDRLVINALNAYDERDRSVSGLVMFSGFRQTEVFYERQKRHTGISKWSVNRKFAMMINIIVQFSMFPIRLGSFAGIVIAAFAFLFMLAQIYNRLRFGTQVPGFILISVLLAFLGGVQLAMLGVLGEYLWRTLEGARRRPLFFVQRLHGRFQGYQPPLPPAFGIRTGPEARHPGFEGIQFPSTNTLRDDNTADHDLAWRNYE
jgi:polyisoprenyl-phosphate glycosyltransferase